MRKTVLALIAGIGLLLLDISPISARTADMSLIGKPAAAQSMVVQAQMDDDAKRCNRQCRRLTGMKRTQCLLTGWLSASPSARSASAATGSAGVSRA